MTQPVYTTKLHLLQKKIGTGSHTFEDCPLSMYLKFKLLASHCSSHSMFARVPDSVPHPTYILEIVNSSTNLQQGLLLQDLLQHDFLTTRFSNWFGKYLYYTSYFLLHELSSKSSVLFHLFIINKSVTSEIYR